ncbi:hypothetical protein Xkoz_00278 [Xenorhabdus kozodoii]|uniref:Uncharacterized protein n=1 Tax=Xenorhabdus kozodoii TaxID=351676 RepID=A0A2D0LI08_9GAMM|nr:hypothetical protein Xkoz_00278 [Xenorhabdus kozodoii]
MLFDQHRVSAVKPGIKPGESKIKSMLKGNNINFNKCVDTYAQRGDISTSIGLQTAT